ncbi:MAG: LysM peptidoglycan-binding domain-containing protein, partial [Mangrovicoccus sp.]|nr:LysM peptidoglycan-binding domain-containing protein [Mangrovicoccus sp.]
GRPGAEIELLVDGRVLWQGAAGPDGSFAALFDLPASPIARMLWLRSSDEAGDPVQSLGNVILAPSSEAELAAANPAAGPAEPAPGTPSAPPGNSSASAPNPAAAPAPLRSDPDGVRPLAPSPLASDQPLALDSVRYGAEGEVILAGRTGGAEGQGARDLSIFLDGQMLSRSRAVEPGPWQAVLPDLPAGDYRLRADLTDPSGQVAARLDLPFRRETPERVEAARIAAAQSDQAAAVITVQPGFTLWAIARDSYGDGFQYVTVFEANSDQIRDPDLIYPGQVLSLPAAAE